MEQMLYILLLYPLLQILLQEQLIPQALSQQIEGLYSNSHILILQLN